MQEMKHSNSFSLVKLKDSSTTMEVGHILFQSETQSYFLQFYFGFIIYCLYTTARFGKNFPMYI